MIKRYGLFFIAIICMAIVFVGPAFAGGSLADVLAWKYTPDGGGVPVGIRTRQNQNTGEMEIFDWPTAKLGPEPTAAQISTWTVEFDVLPPEPDPDAELESAIDAATTLQELKDALLGRAGKAGKIKGKKN